MGPGGSEASGMDVDHELRFRTVSSYVTQMSLVKNCPSHIKGAYKVKDLNVMVIETDDGSAEVSAE